MLDFKKDNRIWHTRSINSIDSSLCGGVLVFLQRFVRLELHAWFHTNLAGTPFTLLSPQLSHVRSRFLAPCP